MLALAELLSWSCSHCSLWVRQPKQLRQVFMYLSNQNHPRCAAERAGNSRVHSLPGWDTRSVLQQCMWAGPYVQPWNGKHTAWKQYWGRSVWSVVWMRMQTCLSQAHFIVDEMLMNGCIVETNKQNVLAPVQLLDRALWCQVWKHSFDMAQLQSCTQNDVGGVLTTIAWLYSQTCFLGLHAALRFSWLTAYN